MLGSYITPSPPVGAERVGVKWGIPERLPTPTSPSHRCAMGPSLSPLEGGEGQEPSSHDRAAVDRGAAGGRRRVAPGDRRPARPRLFRCLDRRVLALVS